MISLFVLYLNEPSLMKDRRCLTNLSDGAKQPTHNESNIHPLAWDDFDGFAVNCLQI